MTVPGIKETVARVLLAEIGAEVSRFATLGHLVSWAHLCPVATRVRANAGPLAFCRGMSGSRPRSFRGSGRPSSVATYICMPNLSGARRGAKKAIVAVAASMLGAVYHMLLREVPY